jgi:dihydrodipicolinate synthase/N-acetylneuraminate lyase
MRELKDYVLPLVTPFRDDGEVDFKAAAAVVRYTQQMPGCGGLYFASVYQEFWTLAVSERVELMTTVIDEADESMPRVVGVSSASVTDTKLLVRAAADQDVDYLMVWPPTSGPRDEKGVLGFYRRVLDQTDLPCFLYTTHLEELNYFLSTGAIETLAQEFPHVYGVKDGTGSVTNLLDLTARFAGRLKIGTPFEEYWALARQVYPKDAADFLMGASRALYMQTPERPYLSDALNCIRAGDIAGGLAKLQIVSDLVAIQMESFQRGIHPISLAKYALSLQGGWSAAVRVPTPELDDVTQARVRSVLVGLGMVDETVSPSAGPRP